MSDIPKPPPASIQIQLDEETSHGQYVNLAMVDHTDTEFTLDFIYVLPQQNKGRVRSRIITSPKHMKRLMQAMQDNLARYEAKYGPILLREDGH